MAAVGSPVLASPSLPESGHRGRRLGGALWGAWASLQTLTPGGALEEEPPPLPAPRPVTPEVGRPPLRHAALTPGPQSTRHPAASADGPGGRARSCLGRPVAGCSGCSHQLAADGVPRAPLGDREFAGTAQGNAEAHCHPQRRWRRAQRSSPRARGGGRSQHRSSVPRSEGGSPPCRGTGLSTRKLSGHLQAGLRKEA